MPTENLTTARLAGLEYADGEIIDAKSGLSARADREGRVAFSIRYRFGSVRPRIFLGASRSWRSPTPGSRPARSRKRSATAAIHRPTDAAKRRRCS